MRGSSLVLLAGCVAVCLAVSACGVSGGRADPSVATRPEAPKVGVILPDTTSSDRWETADRPLLGQALRFAGISPVIENAGGDPAKFASLVDGMIVQGVKVLMITNLSSEQGVAVHRKARDAGVPVIDYDRLTLGGTAEYYVSFDNNTVGMLQGQGLVQCLGTSKPGVNIIELRGSPTDNNATQFYDGQQSVLKPLYDSGVYKRAASQQIEQWNAQKGGVAFEQMLSAVDGKVDGVLASNDGLAGAAITVLQKNGLNGRIPVTGQDATLEGLRAILRGDQCMTVYKAVRIEAEAAARLAIALATGDHNAADDLAVGNIKDPVGKRDVKSILLSPELITKANVKRLVSEGYIKAADLCAGDVAPRCDTAGISPA